jgi:hypothetical protein
MTGLRSGIVAGFTTFTGNVAADMLRLNGRQLPGLHAVSPPRSNPLCCRRELAYVNPPLKSPAERRTTL